MKTIPSKIIKAGLATFLIAPAFAIEGPEDDSPPPPQVKQETASLPQFKLPPDNKPSAPAKEIIKTETAFLGVVSGEIPQFLAEHLDLGKAGGVLVRSLAPDSPAAASGIAINDVITAVSGHPVSSQSELSSQITAHKPGETISLDVIHKGKPAKIEVTLGLRPDNISMTEPPSIDQMNLEDLPKEMADHIRDAIGGFDLKMGADQDAVPPQMEEAIRELRNRLMGGKPLLDDSALPKPPTAALPQVQGSATLKMRDNDGSIEVRSKDGAKEVALRDQQDNIVWSGPWNTEEERAAAPDKVRKRMESLNLDTHSNGGGLRFQFNQKSNPPGQDH